MKHMGCRMVKAVYTTFYFSLGMIVIKKFMISPAPTFTPLSLTLFDDMVKFPRFVRTWISETILKFLQAKRTPTIKIGNLFFLFNYINYY